MTSNDWNQNQPQDPNAPQNQPSWDQGAAPQQGWDQTAPQQPGWDQTAPQQPGWDQTAPQQPGWDQTAPQQPGWDQTAPQQGWDQTGMQQQGYDPMAAGWDPNAQYGQPGPTGVEAGGSKRFVGALLDWIAPVIVINVLSGLIFPNDTSTSMSGGNMSYSLTGTGSWFSFLLGVALYVGLAFYASKNNGQTWGRKVAKTQVLGADGQVPSFGQLVGRNFLHILDTLPCFAGWIVGLATKQTFADRIMKTRVYEYNG